MKLPSIKVEDYLEDYLSMHPAEFPLLPIDCFKTVYMAVLTTAHPRALLTIAYFHTVIWQCRDKIYAIAGVLNCFREDELTLDELIACIVSLSDTANDSGRRLAVGLFRFVTEKLIADWGVNLTPEKSKYGSD